MSVLRVSLFGGIRIEHDGDLPREQPTRAVQTLLAYLMLQRHRTHSRDVLAGLFWGEQPEERARGCLSTTLWRLRRVLEPDGVARGTYLIRTADGEIGFNRESDYWLDVAVLESGAERVLARPAVEEVDLPRIDAGLEVYKGELLEGNYSDWALRERERLRALYLKCLARLMCHHRDRAAYEKGLMCGEKILILDPLREEIHREMMGMYVASGQRALAVRQYETCRDLLAAELGVEPLEETQAVHAQIAGAGPERRASHARSAGPRLQPVMQRLREALRGVEQAREQCQRALRLAERAAAGRRRRLVDR